MEKNKDPLNDTVVDLFKKGSNKLIVEIFADHAGQSGGAAEKGKCSFITRSNNMKKIIGDQNLFILTVINEIFTSEWPVFFFV